MYRRQFNLPEGKTFGIQGLGAILRASAEYVLQSELWKRPRQVKARG